ncbi:MAG: homocysteine S-methyltransferase family protein, partial [Candidatus Omnitrophica bacterium]|nr:homocysteine S-methyltransferase family protein [Candidatus Omnitrophota bacterium]
MKKDIRALFKKKIVILDGAAGTEFQARGMPPGACPEIWCVDNSDIVRDVHRAYVEAGADVIYTCTFGANRAKLAQHKRDDVVAINTTLARIARGAAGAKSLVAGDIGPTGAFIKPFGELAFEEAVDIFKEQVRGLLAGGVDLFVIETMIDIQEARAALLAVKEVTRAPVIVTMTFEKSGRTLSGNDPVSALITLQSLGADVVGCNCSVGPAQMCNMIRAMKPYAMVPLVAKPNAGLPRLVNEKTVFTMKAKQFAAFGPRLVAAGASAIGGCCGTTPRYINELRGTLVRSKPQRLGRKTLRALSSARGFVALENRQEFFVVGEKINPTGKQKLQVELSAGNFTLLRELARTQEAAGAKLLDVNVGMSGVDEAALMCQAIGVLAVSSILPLVIDSSNPAVIEEALRFYPGRALINSISGEEKKVKGLLRSAKKYGAMVILLPIAGKKIPQTVPQRIKVIKDILSTVV